MGKLPVKAESNSELTASSKPLVTLCELQCDFSQHQKWLIKQNKLISTSDLKPYQISLKDHSYKNSERLITLNYFCQNIPSWKVQIHHQNTVLTGKGTGFNISKLKVECKKELKQLKNSTNKGYFIWMATIYTIYTTIYTNCINSFITWKMLTYTNHASIFSK